MKMVDSKTRKLLLIVLPIFCLALVGVSVYANSQSRIDTTASADEIIPVEEPNISGVPRVISIDPKSAIEGEDFSYYLRVVDSDTPQGSLSISIKDAPSWIKVDPSSFLLYGVPAYRDRDTQKVTLTITDGSHSIEHTFYLLIMPPNE